ncbi:MAG TPA: hypothetical protein VMD79_05700 [Solirubrobacteraceae bacterium]|nr:hypothetical protein [Solirubrobacteraceae bacterium]
MAAELLARVRAEIEDRLAQLRAAVAEYERLQRAADALEPSPAATTQPVQRRRGGRRGEPAADAGAPASDAASARAPATAGAPARPGAPTRRRQARMGAVEQAIVAALEHGSHTLAELGVVTALPAPALRESLRRLLAAGRVTRASREGRAAYALSDSE